VGGLIGEEKRREEGWVDSFAPYPGFGKKVKKEIRWGFGGPPRGGRGLFEGKKSTSHQVLTKLENGNKGKEAQKELEGRKNKTTTVGILKTKVV